MEVCSVLWCTEYSHCYTRLYYNSMLVCATCHNALSAVRSACRWLDTKRHSDNYIRKRENIIHFYGKVLLCWLRGSLSSSPLFPLCLIQYLCMNVCARFSVFAYTVCSYLLKRRLEAPLVAPLENYLREYNCAANPVMARKIANTLLFCFHISSPTVFSIFVCLHTYVETKACLWNIA